MTEDTEINNVIDFTECKLLHLERTFAEEGNLQHAQAMNEALERYKQGAIEIIFSGGMPYMVLPEDSEAETDEES
tara:strand:- start:217 stop:441 length:225 start_codon:yes stop_codon:yes gene_type:complete